MYKFPVSRPCGQLGSTRLHSCVIFRHVCSFVMSECDLTPLFSSSHCVTACYVSLSCRVLHDMVVLCVQVMVQG